MKKSLFIVLALLVAGMGFAQKAPTTKLISNSEDQIVVNFQLNGYTTTRVKTPQGDQFIVNAPKMASMLEAGAPDLPMFPIPAIIGDQAEMTVNVIDAQYTDYANVEVAPSKGNFSRQINPDDVPYTYGEMYQQDAFWPATQAYLEKPYILRDFRGQNIMVRPFAYNPVTKTLRVYTNMTIAMTKVSNNGENQKATRRSNTIKVDPEVKAQYSRRFINFGEAGAKYTFDEDYGELLIICPDQYMSQMEEFVAWKNQSGRPTTLVSMTTAGGNNDNNIKSYISNFYNDPNHNLEFILLIGEYSDLTPHSMSGGRSDNWFGQLEGSDYYLEALTGRFSVQNANQLQTQINKVIYYERDVPADATWVNKGMGIGYYGAGSGHYGEDDYYHIDKIRDTLLHYTYATVTEHHGGSGGDASVSTISGTTNEGISIINYCNHGSPTSWGVADYSVSNVNQLTNDYKLPIVWSVACQNGQFDVGECFGEAWLRATNNSTGAPTGAIGGMFSWISQPWIPPMYGQDEMVDIFTEWFHADQYNHTLGGVSLNGSMKILDAAPSDNGNTHNTWLLFGDPSCIVRSDNPTSMNLSYSPAALMIGMTQLEITAETSYGIATLSNAEGVLASAKIVDGVATLTFPALSAVETLSLTVIGYNKVTEMVSLDVLPAEGAFVSVEAFTPGYAPVAGESLLSMTFKNVGADPTTGTTNVVLSCEDPNLTFTDNQGSFGVLGANETVTLEDEFAFSIAEGVADGTQIQINVTATCGSNVWTGKARIMASAPIIEFDAFQYAGTFEPGQTQTVVARFNNIGHYQATNAVVTASTSSPYLTLAETTYTVGNIAAEGEGIALFSVTIDEACPTTEVLNLSFVLTADNGVEATGSGVMKNTCVLVFNCTDSYGDGWNNAKLNVSFSDGTPSMQITVPSGSSSYTTTKEVNVGVHVTLTWTSGYYDGECSFTVSYEEGDQITAASNLSSSYNFQFDVNCAGDPVTVDPVQNLVAELDGRTAILRWDAPATGTPTSYLVKRDGALVGEVTDRAFEDPDRECDVLYTYNVIAKYESGESMPESVTVMLDCTAVDENGNAFSIYPNPVNSTLYIQGGDTEYSYVMFNGMGQQVANGNAKGNATINVHGMNKGVYFLRVSTSNGVTTRKVVVE